MFWQKTQIVCLQASVAPKGETQTSHFKKTALKMLSHTEEEDSSLNRHMFF